MSPKLFWPVAMGLLAAACTGSGTDARVTTVTESTDRGRLIVWNEEEIGIAQDGDIVPIESDGALSQVTVAESGALVWTAVEDSPPGVTAVIDAQVRAEIDTPTVPFYYQWSPTASRVAFLGNSASGAGLVFGLIDIESEVVTPLESPSPFFFDWSPDGERLIAHVGGSSLGIIDASTGEVDDLGEVSGQFPAPAWVDEGIVIVINRGPTVAGDLVPVGLQQSSGLVVLVDPDDGTSLELAAIDEPVRLFPGSDHLALVLGAVGSQRIDVVDWSGDPVTTLGEGTIDLAQWSPDGSTLLWTERSDDGTLAPKTWSESTSAEYEAFTPSRVFATAYLPFWDQYDRTISMWAEDSQSFILPSRTDEGPQISVRGPGEAVVEYPGWDMAVWAPDTGRG